MSDVVFLFDVDNTLFDSDGFVGALHAYIARAVGAESAAVYWRIYHELRQQSGYADYLGALQIFRLKHVGDARLSAIATFMLDYPFAEHLFADALAVVQHLRGWGETVILSDGDAVLQPHKIHRAGLAAAVDQRVLIYVHKEQMLDDMQRRYPARHYVMVDDKPQILAAMKTSLGARLTTVLPRQGHYALDTSSHYPPADITIERIGDLLRYDSATLLQAAG